MTTQPGILRTAPLALCGALLAALVGCTGTTGTLDGAPLDDPDSASSDDLKSCLPGSGGVKGVDVSVYQGTVRWSAVRGSGREFALARVSDGLKHVDSSFERNWAGIRAAGMVRGAYQFFRPGQDAAAQADLMIKKVGRLGPGDLPAVIDVEVTDGRSAQAVLQGVSTWVRRVAAGTGRTPLLYTSPGFWAGLKGASAFRGADLWVAHWYTSCPTMPVGFTNFTLWQLSARAQVSGIRGNVDGDRFNGSLAALYGYAGGRPSGSVAGGSGDVSSTSRGEGAGEGAGVGEDVDALAPFTERGAAMGEGVVRGEADQGAELGHPLPGDD